MSSRRSDGDTGADGTGGEYKVGYGKPPLRSRFKPGQSGNPRGRPKKLRVGSQLDTAFGRQLAKRYLLEEAYRPVKVRDGTRSTEVPLIKTIFRQMAISAAQGNRFAQRDFTQLVQKAEADDKKALLDTAEAMIQWKAEGERRIEHARALGQPEPELIPHPDDIIIDFENDTVSVCGPRTMEEKIQWDTHLSRRDFLQVEVSRFAEKYRRSRSGKGRADALEIWTLLQSSYDKLNNPLPDRYRRELQDRCWQPHASLAAVPRYRSPDG